MKFLLLLLSLLFLYDDKLNKQFIPPKKQIAPKATRESDLKKADKPIGSNPGYERFVTMICDTNNEVRYLLFNDDTAAIGKDWFMFVANTDNGNYPVYINRTDLLGVLSYDLEVGLNSKGNTKVRLNNAVTIDNGILLEFSAQGYQTYLYCSFDDLRRTATGDGNLDVKMLKTVDGNLLSFGASVLLSSGSMVLRYPAENVGTSDSIFMLERIKTSNKLGHQQSDKNSTSVNPATKPSDVISKNHEFTWKPVSLSNRKSKNKEIHTVRQYVFPNNDWIGRISQVPNETNWRVEWFKRSSGSFELMASTAIDGATHFTANIDKTPLTSIVDETRDLPVLFFARAETVYKIDLKSDSGIEYRTDDPIAIYTAKGDDKVIGIRSNGIRFNSPLGTGALFVVMGFSSTLVMNNNINIPVQSSDKKTTIASDMRVVNSKFADRGSRLVVLTYNQQENGVVHTFELSKSSSGR